MKNLFLLFVVTAFSLNLATAQDPGKMFKSAEKTLKKFASDPTSVTANDCANAIASMNDALASSELSGQAKYFISKAKVLNMIADEEFKQSTLNPSYKMVNSNSALEALSALKMAQELEGKKKAKDIAYGLTDVELHLNNFGIVAYQNKDYSTAYDNFKASIDAYDMLTGMGKDSRLGVDNLLNDQYFYASVSAYYSERFDDAKPLLEKMYNDGSSEAFVYEALYNINKEADPDKAVAYLGKGREMNPDDTGLLFAEINHYLAAGKLDELIGKLEMAIEKEPDNLSVYNTLGSVYDQLQQNSTKEGDAEKAQGYFDKALENYNAVLAKDESNFDATYSIGALYYNRAATYVEKLNALANDLSSEGMKKYDNVKAEMDEQFKLALPFFEKAEGLNGNDPNTLIALAEIHARLNDLEKSKAYKQKREALGNQ